MITVTGNFLLLVLPLLLMMAPLADTQDAPPEAPPGEATSVETSAQDKDASNRYDVYAEVANLQRMAKNVEKRSDYIRCS